MVGNKFIYFNIAITNYCPILVLVYGVLIFCYEIALKIVILVTYTFIAFFILQYLKKHLKASFKSAFTCIKKNILYGDV